MDLTNLPSIASEKIIMFAAEKEYLEVFEKNRQYREELGTRAFYVGKWMEILCKFGQVCPKWKDLIFGSKMLLIEDPKAGLSISCFLKNLLE